MALRWRRVDVTVPNCWIKSLFFVFISIQKVFSSLHNIPIEPMMADGVSWRCFYTFSGSWQCNLLGSQWDSHKPPDFHPKYLKLCSDRLSKLFKGLEWHGGKWKMTNIFILGWEYPFNSEKKKVRITICIFVSLRGIVEGNCELLYTQELWDVNSEFWGQNLKILSLYLLSFLLELRVYIL